MNRLTLKEESEILAAQERGFVPTEEDNGYDFVTLSDARTFNEKHAKPCACAFHGETGVSITPKTRETCFEPPNIAREIELQRQQRKDASPEP